jgi:hypothetical protein
VSWEVQPPVVSPSEPGVDADEVEGYDAEGVLEERLVLAAARSAVGDGDDDQGDAEPEP